MTRARTCLSTLLAVALAACTSLKGVSDGTVVTCGSSSECPGGRVCNRGRCVDPNVIDTTPADFDAAVVVSPAKVMAGQSFTLTFQATEPLADLEVRLALDSPVTLSCNEPPAVAFSCTYVATGHENHQIAPDGDPVALDVRMWDRSGNETLRKSAATVTFDFVPPSPTIAGVAYHPDTATNPLPDVTLATSGTRVRVAVSADELLAASPPSPPPTLVGRSGGATLAFALEPGGLGSSDAVFATTVAAGLPDGDYALVVGWSDAVGNLGTATVPAVIKVKTSRPTLTVNQANVVFVRSPWGNAAREDLGGYTIPAGPYFAIEPADPLSGATRLPAGTFLLGGGVVPNRIQVKAGSTVVGTLLPDAAGTWPRRPLWSPDTFTVDVVGYDDAGNPSDPRAIASVEWVATSNLPPIGESPHSVRRTPLAEASRVQRSEVEDVVAADVAGADGAGALAVAEEVWRRMRYADAEGVVEGAALAYDSARGRVVRFGGDLGGLLDEVREWDGAGWIDLTPATGSPPARRDAALAYDGARGRVVLFGGRRSESMGEVCLADTWEWDGTHWEQRISAVAPPGRYSAAMAYDSARARVVLFGGWGDSGNLGDTWEWDGEGWTSVARAGPRPDARSHHALAYDPALGALGRTVLYGGATDQVVWKWDGASWTSTAPAGSPPVATAATAMVYDVARGRIVVFGAWQDSGAHRGGAWEWDGTSWTSLTVAGAFPFFDVGPVAHDAARGRTVLFTNRTEWRSPVDGTWEWDGGWWRNVTPTGVHPPARYSTALAYDSGRRRMVLRGGSQDVPSGLWDGSTWEWDGSSWTSVAPAASGPAGMWCSLVYDVRLERMLAVSEYDAQGEIWSWDGASWTSVTPATQRFENLIPYGGTVITFGRGTVWEWTGADWIAIGPASSWPTTSGGSLHVYDDVNRRLLVHAPGPLSAGNPVAQPVWVWDGSAWTSVTPAGPTPPLRAHGAAMSFDSERGRALLFGGTASGSGNVALQDTWEWNGTGWRDATPAGTKPFGRRDLPLAYDSHRHRTVLFGGHDAGGGILRSDTWELEARPGTRPAIQFDVSAARTGVTPAAIGRMRVRAHAGGSFTLADPGAAGGIGATLRGWTSHSAEAGPGGWVPLATNAAGATATPPYLGPPATTFLAWDAGAAEARRFMTERDGRLSFQVVPSGTMGPDPGGARVALDYIEVRIRYAAVP